MSISSPQGTLAGQVALVTGAARSNGIGFASALCLGRAGARVIITDTTGDSIAELLRSRVEELRADGIDATEMCMDVTRPDEVERCIASIDASHGRIDIIFNNAGYAGGTGPFESISLEQWHTTLSVNLMGIVHASRAALPIMRRQGSGVIISTASLAGLGAVPLMAAYTASKFAVIGLTKALACELGPDNIRVNAICPGMVWTEMGRFETELLGQAAQTVEERKVSLARDVPLGQRWAEPDEIASVVLFLAGPGARYLTGVAVPVSGGLPAGL